MTPAIRFALIGNPNCGKTSLFNRLTGARAKVANYPGVTVERRSGRVTGLDHPAELLDLPGTYSLFVTSPDEQVARDVILGQLEGERRPDLLVAVVDACNLRLGLRLVMELRSLNRPLLLALNQMDEAKRRGISIDVTGLSSAIGIPIVETVAVNAQGVQPLRQALESYTRAPGEDDDTQVLSLSDRQESIEALYSEIESLMRQYVIQPAEAPQWQDRLDALVMHPVLGVLFLFSILLVIFQAVFAWASPLVDVIDGAFSSLGEWVAGTLPEGILQDFIANGLIAGVGGVLVFLPQILILFFFILLLEDSGYLTRAAFLLDRIMRGLGLSGRSFIPLLSSFACAVPGIMATRTISDPRERFVTIMVAPLMTCSARLPVYALIIAAFIPQQTVWGIFNLQGLTLFFLYLAGIVSAALVAWIMRRQQAREEFPLLLELPSYRWPMAYHLLMGLRERAWIFIRRVGTIILSLSIILWFLASFPGAPEDATLPAIDYSFAGQLGHFMQPLFAPLGFNWQMCIALIPAMGAREVAVSALATVYAVGEDSIETALGATLAASWSLPVAFAYLAWFVYAPQCISTIAVVKRETNSLKSTIIFTVYLFALAYFAGWATFQVASAILN
ncbi:ferrous iron transporter B [Cellvibrio japonicus]|uniref:Ferrous iron transport protein B n=1 Tax=Cellvibrio japonicus (strain Ueda107) TaxID=498211 RepID=B3PBU0_CELJU|nr:ferrous iron transporter B [Cellvibrio japonicus]ACE86288.1 ferrous iron transport protein B [Cellvibrio japonicus Ueda107]QEI11758.1 ferrous iron transporter B [Cellvibrio japonicus]QEI15332.1 ferrous iron transporter B [Cellvibrio japonicus]QEI18912.1 ferrous iron transporter B [Cellvibrio japonicus]